MEAATNTGIDLLGIIIQIIATGGSMLIMAIGTLYLARKTGLHDIQVAAKSEMKLLIDVQDSRIEFLEGQVKELREENTSLRAQIKSDRARIKSLERVIANKNIEESA